MHHRLWEMAIGRVGAMVAPAALDEIPDADLLRRFIDGRDEAAFAAIVRRHGPLVWGVCRNHPAGAEAFKRMLVRYGQEGWEYVGPVPASAEELIFKRSVALDVPGMGMMGGGSGLGRSDPELSRVKRFTGVTGVGGSSSPSGTVDPNSAGAGAVSEDGMGATGGPPKLATIELSVGGTARYKYPFNQEVEQVNVSDNKVVEVTLDPSNTRRVIIRGMKLGGSQIELTDAAGTKQKITVRVK